MNKAEYISYGLVVLCMFIAMSARENSQVDWTKTGNPYDPVKINGAILWSIIIVALWPVALVFGALGLIAKSHGEF